MLFDCRLTQGSSEGSCHVDSLCCHRSSGAHFIEGLHLKCMLCCCTMFGGIMGHVFPNQTCCHAGEYLVCFLVFEKTGIAAASSNHKLNMVFSATTSSLRFHSLQPTHLISLHKNKWSECYPTAGTAPSWGSVQAQPSANTAFFS